MISIVVPTYNEERNIKGTIESLIYLKTKRKYEILIVDSSDDRTLEIVKGYQKKRGDIRIIKSEGKNIAKARNLGIKNAKGDFILFIDSGYSAPSDWIERMMALFKSEDIFGVGGGIENRNQDIIPTFTSLDKIYREGFESKYVDVVSFTNAAFKKEIFKKVGLLDEAFSRRCETSDICYRIVNAGFKLFFDPDVKVFKHEDEKLSTFLKINFQNGFWHFRLYMKHKRRIRGDDYRSKGFILQPLVWLFLPLFLLNVYLLLLPSILIFTINLRFILYCVEKKGYLSLLYSFVLLNLRSIMHLLGFLTGALYKIIK